MKSMVLSKVLDLIYESKDMALFSQAIGLLSFEELCNYGALTKYKEVQKMVDDAIDNMVAAAESYTDI